ncbi:hypothetical protein PHOBOS_98 [Erwinia phage vB_EamM_Phobos]|uniref:hypothetical protein n=1 Tax=Erwinia phage vB_EamM_Phobos TaxID=1883377 RepID=UPI00081C9D53|nr:hypothetical protein BIZ79_gp098 [Erwinia phage vB_EamM_Phobos]ANZ50288.1 hypothetical protein PHOBOS_98 [Erwinia phage vB_EamM_Phobos]
MVTIKNAVASEGRRYTFKVKCYSLPVHLGWTAARIWGRVWYLPPGLSRHLEANYIDAVFRAGESPQLRDFNRICAAYTTRVGTTDATRNGVYWDGKNLFYVGQKYSKPTVKEVRVETAKGNYIGIDVTVTGENETLRYQLLTDMDVDIRTFYKYLLFYKHRISVRAVVGAFGKFASMPYPRDKRLEGECITMNLDGTLLDCARQLRQKTTA